MKTKILFSVFLISFSSTVICQNNRIIDSLLNCLDISVPDSNKVNCLNTISLEYRNIKNNELALQYATSAHELAKWLSYKEGLATSYQNIGYTNDKMANYPEAVKNLTESIKIYGEIGDKFSIGRTYNDIGNILVKQGKYTEAAEKLNYSLKIAEEIGKKSVIAHMYNNIGIIYSKQGNYTDAKEHFYIALHIFQELQRKWDIADSYNNIGIVNQEQGNYAEALENCLAALKIRKEIGHKGRIASCYINIGNIYKAQEKYTEALQHYFISLEFIQEVRGGSKIKLANIYHNIGNTYQKQGNYTEARKNYLTALNIREEIKDWDGIADSYNSIGLIDQVQGNFTEALENYFASLELSKEIQDKAALVNSYIGIGAIYKIQGKTQEARKYLIDGLRLSKETGAKENIASIYLTLSSLDSTELNYKMALEHYQLHILYKDSLYNIENDKRIAQLQIQYETEKKDQEIELLNRDNKIKALQLDQQKASLLASKLEAERQKSELLLMNSTMENQRLTLAEAQRDLEYQQAEAKINDAQLELTKKENALKEEQLEKQKILRNAMITGTSLLLIAGLLLFRSLRLRKRLEKNQAIIQERKRISADLHDDVGSGLSRIMMLSELVKHEAQIPEARKDAEKISTISQELSSNISEIIWALNSNNDYMKNTVAYIRHYATEYFDETPVKLKISTPENIDDIPIRNEMRRNLFYAVKEALHNIFKHANATEARLDFILENKRLSVVVQDNGIGMTNNTTNQFGNGLINMRQRMANINGSLNIESHKGTKITLTMPV
jgi:signal transduction histidine kinase/uncharacterized protein HemY